jgi:hypothetical protein
MAVVFMFVDDYIAPMIFDSRIERIHETGLPKASVENGCVYCRMKADDFRLPLPSGFRVMPPTITAGGFDWVDGSVKLLFDSTNRVWASGYGQWLPGRLPTGGSATIEPIPGGMLIKFHYFGDR